MTLFDLAKRIADAIYRQHRLSLSETKAITISERQIFDIVEDTILLMDYVPNPKRTQTVVMSPMQQQICEEMEHDAKRAAQTEGRTRSEKSPLQGIAEAMRRAVPGGLIPVDELTHGAMQVKIDEQGNQIGQHRYTANEVQVGGDHYRTNGKYQIWDLVVDMGWDFFQGNVISYVHRYRQKGGVDDLRKARHYLDKMIEIEEAKKSEGEKS